MSWGEDVRRDTGLEFSFRVSVVVLTCLSLVSSSQVRVWCESAFWSAFRNWGRNFSLSSRCPGLCSLASLPPCTRLLTHIPTQVVALLLPGVDGGTSVFANSTLALKILDHRYFLVIFNHPWLADLQLVLKPEPQRGQLAVSVDSMSAFSSSFFFFPPSFHRNWPLVLFMTWTWYYLTVSQRTWPLDCRSIACCYLPRRIIFGADDRVRDCKR